MQVFLGTYTKTPSGKNISVSPETILLRTYHGFIQKTEKGSFQVTVSFQPSHKMEDQSHCIMEDKNCISFTNGRIDNRRDLQRQFGFSETNNDQQLVHALFLQQEEQTAALLSGDFAFGAYNPDSNKIYLARDHMGVKAIYYYEDDAVFAFSNSLSALSQLVKPQLSMRESFLVEMLTKVNGDPGKSCYHEISVLPPAHSLQFDGNRCRVERYWHLRENQTTVPEDPEDIVAGLRQKLEEAVKERVAVASGVAAELSGGIDSSTVTALSAHFAPETLAVSHCLSKHQLGNRFPYQDEQKWSRMVVENSHIKQLKVEAKEDWSLPAMLGRMIDIQGGLTKQGLETYVFEGMKAAKKKHCKLLLSGFGGDEMVSNAGTSRENEWAARKEFKKMRKTMRKKRMKRHHIIKKTIKTLLPGFLKNLYYTRKKSYKQLARKQHHHFVLPDKKKRYKIAKKTRQRILHFLEDLPQNQKEIRRLTNEGSHLRLQYGEQAAMYLGMDYAYPLLDKELIEYYASIPGELKTKDPIHRKLIREAIQDYLPPEIAMRPDKTGTTIPYAFLLMQDAKDEMRGLISEAQEKINHPLIDYAKMYEELENNTREDAETRIPQIYQNGIKIILFLLNHPEIEIK